MPTTRPGASFRAQGNADRIISRGFLWEAYHADLHLGNLLGSIRLDGTGEKATEGCLSSSILAHHDDNLGICEVTGIDAEMEVTERLLHLGVPEGAGFIRQVVLSAFSYPEGQALVTESQVFSGNMAVEEDYAVALAGPCETSLVGNSLLMPSRTE